MLRRVKLEKKQRRVGSRWSELQCRLVVVVVGRSLTVKQPNPNKSNGPLESSGVGPLGLQFKSRQRDRHAAKMTMHCSDDFKAEETDANDKIQGPD